VGSLTLQGSWGVDLSGLGQPRLQRTDRLNLALTFSGWPTVRPNLSYTESTTSVLYGGESRGTVARSLTAHVLWTPEPQARDDLSISIRGTDARDGGSLSATAQNSLAYTISDVLSGRLDFDGTCERGVTRQDLSASLKGTVDLTLSQTWRASGSLSYLFGWTPSTTFYQSLLLELFVSATF